jgi:carbonic anhydrase/acetyltransferase-like protein (isoleucine patch superfamily)
VIGAVVILGEERSISGGSSTEPSMAEGPLAVPFSSVEVLGRSVLSRLFDELRRASVDVITLLADSCFAPVRPAIDETTKDIPLVWVQEAWSAATQLLGCYRESGIEDTFVIRAGVHAELDLVDLLQFHRAQRRVVTRACDERGPLDMWVVELALMPNVADSHSQDLRGILRVAEPPFYAVTGYVNRLEEHRDLRRLAVDSLSSLCRLRPHGSELRPGVWMDAGAQVHRMARIVAPAFVGRGSKVEEQCLITRGSSLERDCMIDYGTVVEDSSILSNSYVGIGLDLSHSVVHGNNLVNLEHGVALQIFDPGVIRQNRVPHAVASEPPSLGSEVEKWFSRRSTESPARSRVQQLQASPFQRGDANVDE